MPSAERSHWAHALLGGVLRDKWRLDRLIAFTESGAVYAGTHRNGREAAIKILVPELSRDETVRARFLREGYVANRLRHPGAVAVLDDDVAEDGSAFLVMELLVGETLHARWLRQGMRLDLAELMQSTDQLLEVLAAAHDLGIIHRDIKPQNLMLLQNGGVKLLDFGLALLPKTAGETWSLPAAISDAVESTAMGTPAFMPPEQAMGRWDLLDGRSDLWALGATLFTLISGRHVHEAQDVVGLVTAAATRRAPSLGAVARNIPPDVVEVVDRALAFEQAERWPDARAMKRALRLGSPAFFRGSSPAFAPLPLFSSSAPLLPPSTLNQPPSGEFSFGALGPVLIFALIVGTIVLGMYFAVMR